MRDAETPEENWSVQSEGSDVIFRLYGIRFTLPRDHAYQIGLALIETSRDDPRLNQY